MRQAARVDRNQASIVNHLRMARATVQVLSQVGRGVPDLLVGYFGHNFLVEVKSGRPYRMTKDQVSWHLEWGADVIVAHTASLALLEMAKQLREWKIDDKADMAFEAAKQTRRLEELEWDRS